MPGDLVTISNKLQAKGRLEQFGGPAHLTHLLNCTPSSIHAEFYARIVKQMAVRRELIRQAGKLARSAYDEGFNIFDVGFIMSDVESAIKQAEMEAARYREIQELLEEKEPPEFLWYGYIPYGELSLLAGREGTGKSAIIQDLIRRVQNGELMPDNQKPNIKAKNILFIDAEDFISDWLQRIRWWQDAGMWHSIEGLKVMEYPQNGVLDFANPDHQTWLIDIVKETQPFWIVLDSWQAALVKATFDEQVAHVIQFLKNVAKSFNCAITLTSHMNKQNSDPYTKPSSSDIKGAGAMAYKVRATHGMYRIQLGGKKDLRNDGRIWEPIRVSGAPHPDPLACIFKPLHPRGFLIEYHDPDELFGLMEAQAREEAEMETATERAEGWIVWLLRMKGPMTYSDLKAAAKEEGLGTRAVINACKLLRQEGRLSDTIGYRKQGNKLRLADGNLEELL